MEETTDISLSFTELLASLRQSGTGYQATAPRNWTQGRTLYGGISTALCAEAARRSLDALPPLRSAQITFVGPSQGTLDVSSELLRRGKNAAIVSARLDADGAPATQATLIYGEARQSSIRHDDFTMPDVPPPDACPEYYKDVRAARFTRNFDIRLVRGALPISGAGVDPSLLLWVRHRDENPADAAVRLLALADVAPVAAVLQYAEVAPVSSMNWSLDLLNPSDGQGWHLVSTSSEWAANGYSAQQMLMWNEKGEAVVTGRQIVALFA